MIGQLIHAPAKMKNFLQNLLIVLSLCLCAMIAFQWVREIKLRRDVQSLTDTVRNKEEASRSLERTVELYDEEIKRLDGIKNKLSQIVKSNDFQIGSLSRELERTKAQREVYRQAVERQNEAIRAQNENIKKQNGDLLRLVEERNASVSNFNKVTQDFNDLARKWNQQQEELAAAAAATNAPAKTSR